MQEREIGRMRRTKPALLYDLGGQELHPPCPPAVLRSYRRPHDDRCSEHTCEILLAEDNPADVYLVREALREHGVDCAVRVATDGAEVLRIISSEQAWPEAQHLGLIILDLNLPRHDGTEILQRLQETPEFTHVPVVVLTSSDSPRDRLMAASRLGAACYLRKPSSLEQFLTLGAVFKDMSGTRRKRDRGVNAMKNLDRG
jgi:two-component system, chemotaxis family, response regulator Rcp1